MNKVILLICIVGLLMVMGHGKPHTHHHNHHHHHHHHASHNNKVQATTRNNLRKAKVVKSIAQKLCFQQVAKPADSAANMETLKEKSELQHAIATHY